MDLIAVRLPDELKEKLLKIAEEQHRPLSNLVRLIILEWLEKQEPKKPKK